MGAGLIVGILTGIAGLVVTRHAVYLAGVAWPWGLVLTLAAVPAVLLAVSRAWSQAAAWSAAAGWFLPVALIVVFHPGGDQIPGQDATGSAYLILGVIVAVATVLMSTSQPVRRTDEPATPSRSGPPASPNRAPRRR
jgi:hypothetical protein